LLIFIFAKLLNMNKISTYLKESYRELIEKVTWPTWLQLQQSTVIVLVATLLITGVVWVMDLVAQQALKFIYSLI
jgi:preprotein translocase subunit SecE